MVMKTRADDKMLSRFLKPRVTILKKGLKLQNELEIVLIQVPKFTLVYVTYCTV